MLSLLSPYSSELGPGSLPLELVGRSRSDVVLHELEEASLLRLSPAEEAGVSRYDRCWLGRGACW